MRPDCCVIRDLLPLYAENMVSEQTAEYIRHHLTLCPDCQREYHTFQDTDPLTLPADTPPAEVKPFKKAMRRLNRQLHGLSYGLIVFFILWGFLLTGGEHLMYNSVIMPIVGVFGYYAFRWKALYKMPVLLLIINLLAYRLHFVQIDFLSVFPWTAIYSIFVVLGVVIAFLLHYAFRKE